MVDAGDPVGEAFDVVVVSFSEAAPEPPAIGLKRTFGLDDAAARRLLAALPVAVKRGVPRVRAEYFRRALSRIGAHVEVRDGSGHAVAPLESGHAQPPSATPGSSAATGSAAPRAPVVSEGERGAAGRTWLVAPAPSAPQPPSPPAPDQAGARTLIEARPAPPAGEPPAALAGRSAPAERPASDLWPSLPPASLDIPAPRLPHFVSEVHDPLPPAAAEPGVALEHDRGSAIADTALLSGPPPSWPARADTIAMSSPPSAQPSGRAVPPSDPVLPGSVSAPPGAAWQPIAELDPGPAQAGLSLPAPAASTPPLDGWPAQSLLLDEWQNKDLSPVDDSPQLDLDAGGPRPGPAPGALSPFVVASRGRDGVAAAARVARPARPRVPSAAADNPLPMAAPASFYERLGDAMVLPLRGTGLYWIAAISVWSVAVGVLSMFAQFVPLLGAAVAFFAQTSILGFACDFARGCFWVAPSGDERLDGMPQLDPARILHVYIKSGLHLSLFIVLSQFALVWWVVMQMLDGAGLSILGDPITWAFALLPSFYWPMGVGIASSTNNFAAIWNLPAGLVAIRRAPLEYLLIGFLAAAVFGLSSLGLIAVGAGTGVGVALLPPALGFPLAITHGLIGSLMGHLAHSRPEVFED